MPNRDPQKAVADKHKAADEVAEVAAEYRAVAVVAANNGPEAAVVNPNLVVDVQDPMMKGPFDLCQCLNRFWGTAFFLTQRTKMYQNDDFHDENDAHNQESQNVYQTENAPNTHYLCTEFLQIQMYVNYDDGFPDDDDAAGAGADAHNPRSEYVNQTDNFQNLQC